MTIAEEIIETLARMKSQHSCLRFGQIIYNATHCANQADYHSKLFYMTDEKFLAALLESEKKMFIDHLNKCTETVKSWPEWKQNLLGKIMGQDNV